jgi:hypothetical protein
MTKTTKFKLAWRYRKQLWKYRKLIMHRKEIAGALAATAIITAVVLTRGSWQRALASNA